MFQHYGECRDTAYHLFQSSTKDKLTEKKKEFYSMLNAQSNTKCEICNENCTASGGVKSFNEAWKHSIEKHKDIFTFVNDEVCGVCNIKVVSHKPQFAQFAHHIIEHKEFVQVITNFLF